MLLSPCTRKLTVLLRRNVKGLTVCFFIFACVVSSNANAGFNVILTALIYVAYVGLLATIFNKKRSVSVLLGARVVACL